MTYLNLSWIPPGPEKADILTPGINLTTKPVSPTRDATSYGVTSDLSADWLDQTHCLKLEHQAAAPRRLWRAQVQRVQGRLEHQAAYPERKKTYTATLDLGHRYIAENIVREQWIEQGIWDDRWGPANAPAWSDAEYAKWYADGVRTPPGIDQPNPWAMLDWPCRTHFRSSQGFDTRHEPKGSRTESSYCYPREDCHDPTRPRAQFLSALPYEQRWVEDEVEFGGCDTPLDIKTVAYCSLRKNWIEDGVWQSKWELIPGEEWLHETVDEPNYIAQRLKEIGINPGEVFFLARDPTTLAAAAQRLPGNFLFTSSWKSPADPIDNMDPKNWPKLRRRSEDSQASESKSNWMLVDGKVVYTVNKEATPGQSEDEPEDRDSDTPQLTPPSTISATVSPSS